MRLGDYREGYWWWWYSELPFRSMYLRRWIAFGESAAEKNKRPRSPNRAARGVLPQSTGQTHSGKAGTGTKKTS